MPRTASRARARRVCERPVARIAAAVLAGVAAAVVMAAPGGFAPSSQPAPERPAGSIAAPPNVVVIVADDLSWDLVRLMPQVRRLQRDGLTLRRFIVSDSLCCVSRASLLTGRYPHSTGVRSNDPPDGGYARFRAGGAVQQSVAVALRRRGYRTGLFGKYLNHYHARSRGMDPGWSTWLVSDAAYRGFDYWLNADGRPVFFGHRPRDYLTDVIARRGAGFIRDAVRARRPFVAVLSTFAPHAPCTPAPRDQRRFRHLRLPRGAAFDRPVVDGPLYLRGRPPLGRAVRSLRRLYRRRARAVLAVDALLGRVRRTLARHGIADRTYVWVTSDNGFHLGQHRLTYGKRTAFDTDVRVPAVVAGPGVPRGSRTAALAGGIDLAPTLLDLTGDRRPARGRDGRSLVALLHGRRPAHWRRALLVEHAEDRTVGTDPDRQTRRMGMPGAFRALRTPRFTYVAYANGDRELYDHRADPAQLVNRAWRVRPAVRRRFDAVVARLARCRGAGCRRADRAPVSSRAPTPAGSAGARTPRR